MKLWTIWADYFATGEGRTMCALITYSETEVEVQDKFRNLFGDWYSQGMQIAEGVIRNEVTNFVFSERAFLTADAAARGASVSLHGQVHFNFS